MKKWIIILLLFPLLICAQKVYKRDLGRDVKDLMADSANAIITDTLNYKVNRVFNVLGYGATGNGTTDDLPAIQNCLDAATLKGGTVVIPYSSNDVYLIDGTLSIGGNTHLLIGDSVTIKSAANSDTFLVINSDIVNGNNNIIIEGGIFDGNNANVARQDGGAWSPGWNGIMIWLQDIADLTIRDVTLRNPESFGIIMSEINYFTVENIRFDYDNVQNNMDGIHVNGNVENGVFRNLQGNTYDDLLALNADDSWYAHQGYIKNILVDGIYAPAGYRAVRLRSGASAGLIDDVTIQNIYGNYEYEAVFISTYETNGTGNIGSVTIKNVTSESDSGNNIIMIDSYCKSVSIDGVEYNHTGDSDAIIQVDPNVHIENLSIKNITVIDSVDAATGIVVLELYGINTNVLLENVNYHSLIDTASRGTMVNIREQTENLTVKGIRGNWISKIVNFAADNRDVEQLTISNIQVDSALSKVVDLNTNCDIKTLNIDNINCSGLIQGSLRIINFAKLSSIEYINMSNMNLYGDVQYIAYVDSGCVIKDININNLNVYSTKTNLFQVCYTYSPIGHLNISNANVYKFHDFTTDIGVDGNFGTISLNNVYAEAYNTNSKVFNFKNNDTTAIIQTNNLVISGTTNYLSITAGKDIRLKTWDFQYDATDTNIVPTEGDFMIHNGDSTLTKGPVWFDGTNFVSLIDSTIVAK